jgi:nucleoside-diphosphate-sugar epimerase
MKIFVTGATGYIGHSLSMKLAEQGNTVHVLVRDEQSLFVPQHPNIRIFEGDIRERASIVRAMRGCEQVFHTAASIKIWVKNSDDIFKTNVEGTSNVLTAAREENISRVVFTSTCGVIGPCLKEPMTENDPRIIAFAIDYELSKKMAEDMVLQYAKKGMNALVVCPAKVHGPGKVSHSIAANSMIERFLKKGIAFIPSPGTYKSCFAFIDDVVEGHLLAMEKGRAGEKYILGGINITHQDFFDCIRAISEAKGHIIQLSKIKIKGWALLQLLNYTISGRHPFFTFKMIDHMFNNYCFSSEKAIHELGYRITPLEQALQQTIQYLNHPLYA